MPDTQNIKLAALFMDKTGKNNYGILINPTKIQKISSNQALFTIQLDGEMTGIESNNWKEQYIDED